MDVEAEMCLMPGTLDIFWKDSVRRITGVTYILKVMPGTQPRKSVSLLLG